MQGPSKHLHHNIPTLPIAAAESWEFFCRPLQMLILSTDRMDHSINSALKASNQKHINPDAQIISHDHWAAFINAHSSSTDVFYSPPNKPGHLLDLFMFWICCCSAELPYSFERLGFSTCRVPPSHYHIMWLCDLIVTAVSLFLTQWQHHNLLKGQHHSEHAHRPSYEFNNASKSKHCNTLISCAASFSRRE